MANPQVFDELSTRINKNKRTDSGIHDSAEFSIDQNKSNGRPPELNDSGRDSDNNDGSIPQPSSGKKSMKKKFTNLKKMFKRTKKKKDGNSSKSEENLSSQMKAQSEPDLLSRSNDTQRPPPQMHRYNSQVTKPMTGMNDSKLLSDDEEHENKGTNNSFKRDAQQYIRTSLRKFKIKRRKSGSSDSSSSDVTKPAPSIVKPQPIPRVKPTTKDFAIEDDDSFFMKTPRDESFLSSPETSFNLADVTSQPNQIETSAAKDKIRVAPQGRRKPSRFRSPPPPSSPINASLQQIKEIDSQPSSKRSSSYSSQSRESLNKESLLIKNESFGERRTASDAKRPKPPRRPKPAISSEEITTSSKPPKSGVVPQRSKSTNSRENVNNENSFKKPSSARGSSTGLSAITNKTQSKSLTHLPKDNKTIHTSGSHDGFAMQQYNSQEEEIISRNSKTEDILVKNKSSSALSFHERSIERLYAYDNEPSDNPDKKSNSQVNVSKKSSFHRSNEDLYRRKSKEQPSSNSDSFFKSEALTSSYNKDVYRKNSEENISSNVELVNKRNSLNSVEATTSKRDSLRQSREDINATSELLVKKRDSLRNSSNVDSVSDSLRHSREDLSNTKESIKRSRIGSQDGRIRRSTENLAAEKIVDEPVQTYGETTFALTSPTQDLELPPDFLRKAETKEDSEKVVIRDRLIENGEKRERPLSVKIRSTQLQTSSKQTVISTSKSSDEIKDLGKSLKPFAKPKPSPRPRPHVTSPTNDRSTVQESPKVPEFNRISLKRVPKTDDFLGNDKQLPVEITTESNTTSVFDETIQRSVSTPIKTDVQRPALSPKSLSKNNDMISHDVQSPRQSTSPVSTSPIETSPEPDFRRFSLKRVPKREDYHASDELSTTPSNELPTTPSNEQTTDDADTRKLPDKPHLERMKDFDRQRSSSVGRKSPKPAPKPPNIDSKPFSFQSRDIVRSKTLSAVEARRLREQSSSPTEDGPSQVPSWVKLAKAKQRSDDVEENVEDRKDEDHLKTSPPKPTSPKPTSPPVSTKSYTISTTASLKLPSPPTTSSIQQRNAQSFKVQGDNVCIVCGKTAYMFERCEVDKRTLHKNCAKCENCGRKLNVGGIFIHENKPYCSQHKQT